MNELNHFLTSLRRVSGRVCFQLLSLLCGLHIGSSLPLSSWGGENGMRDMDEAVVEDKSYYP